MPPEDTGQPLAAPETELTVAEAGAAFKALDAPSERPRNPDGTFAREAQEIEAEAEPETVEAEAESQDEGEPEPEAAEEAQPEEPVLPESWPADKAELWNTLDPDAQAFIRQRDIEAKSAVNARFMEAANARKAAEAQIAEAQANRANALAVLDTAIAVLQPQAPPLSMLDISSSDYDPDTYHYQKAQAESQAQYVQNLLAQRQQLTAQEQQEAMNAVQQQDAEINEKLGPAFMAEYPDSVDPQKAQGFFADLIKFGVEAGLPAEMFRQSQPNIAEWQLLADAKKWRAHKAALEKARQGKPEPRKALPVVRPGVTTPRSAVEASRRQAASERLARSGSIEDAAAVFKLS